MTDYSLPPGSIVWAYLRDSGGVGQERSAEQQLAEAEKFCRERGLVLLRERVYVDSITGATDHRERFLEMIQELRRLAPERGPRHPDAPAGILYWDIKRFSRSQDDGAFYRADLRRRGYVLVSLSDDIPSGDLAPVFESLFQWKAEQDLRDLSKDIKRGHRDLVLATGPDGRYLNLWPGRRPYGFHWLKHTWGTRRDGKPRMVGRLIPDRGGEWERVQRAFAMRADGHSYSEMHRELDIFVNFTGYRRMMENEIYAGTLRYGKVVVEHWIEAAVDRETWDRVQARRQPRGAHNPRLGTSDYTLSGFLQCPHGDASMTGHSVIQHVADGRKRYRYYICSNYNNSQACSPRAVKADPLERAVYEALATEALTAGRVRAMLASGDSDAHDDREAALQRRVERARAGVQDLDAVTARLVAGIEAGGDIPALVAALAARQVELDRARRELAAAERELRAVRAPAVDEAMIEDFCTHVGAALGEGDVRAVRRLLEQLGVRIEMHDLAHGEIHYRLPREMGDLAGSVLFAV